jgi:hypothetical protein
MPYIGNTTSSFDVNTNNINNGAVTTEKLASPIDPTVSSINGGPISGARNRIINGDMRIDQRNAGAAISAATLATGGYLVDRFQFLASQSAKFSAQQNQGSVTPPAGFSNYLGLTVASAVSIGSSDYFLLRQAIEGFNSADLAWGTASAATVTLSFRVYSSLTGTFGGVLKNGAGNRSYPFTYSVPAANTWTTITITVAGDTSGTWASGNTTGIFVTWGLGVGSTLSGTAGAWAAGDFNSAVGATSIVGTNGATFYITGVQLEPGTVATPFERRNYGAELSLCQRYFQSIPAFRANSFENFLSYYGGTLAVSPDTQLLTTMRATPTGTIFNSGVEYYSYSGSWVSTTLLVSLSNSQTFYLYAASDGDGRGKLMRNGSSGLAAEPIVFFSSEL